MGDLQASRVGSFSSSFFVSNNVFSKTMFTRSRQYHAWQVNRATTLCTSNQHEKI